MEPEQRGGMRTNDPSSGGQWDDPSQGQGTQGKWEQRQGKLSACTCRVVSTVYIGGCTLPGFMISLRDQGMPGLLLIYFYSL